MKKIFVCIERFNISITLQSKQRSSLVLISFFFALVAFCTEGLASQSCLSFLTRQTSLTQKPKSNSKGVTSGYWQRIISLQRPWQRPLDRIVEVEIRNAVSRSIYRSFELFSGYSTFESRYLYYGTEVLNRRDTLIEQSELLEMGRRVLFSLKGIEQSEGTMGIRQRWFESFKDELDDQIMTLKLHPPSNLREDDLDTFEWALNKVFINEVQFMKLIEGSIKIYTRHYRSRVLTKMASIRSGRVLRWFLPDDPFMGLLVYPALVAVPIGLAASTGVIPQGLSGVATLILGSGLFVVLPTAFLSSLVVNLPQQLFNVPRSFVNRVRQGRKTQEITGSIFEPTIEFISQQKASIRTMQQFLQDESKFNFRLPDLMSESSIEQKTISPQIIDKLSDDFAKLGTVYKSMSKLILGQVLNVPHPFKQENIVAFEILRLQGNEGETFRLNSKDKEILENESRRLALRDKLISLAEQRLQSIGDIALQLQDQIEQIALNELELESPFLDLMRLERFNYLQSAVSVLVQSIFGTLKIIERHQRTVQETAELLEHLESTGRLTDTIRQMESLTVESQLLESELRILVDMQNELSLVSNEKKD